MANAPPARSAVGTVSPVRVYGCEALRSVGGFRVGGRGGAARARGCRVYAGSSRLTAARRRATTQGPGQLRGDPQTWPCVRAPPRNQRAEPRPLCAHSRSATLLAHGPGARVVWLERARILSAGPRSEVAGHRSGGKYSEVFEGFHVGKEGTEGKCVVKVRVPMFLNAALLFLQWDCAGDVWGRAWTWVSVHIVYIRASVLNILRYP